MLSARARELAIKYPDRVPVHVRAVNGELQNKYLIPKDMVLSSFMVILRKKINVKAHEAIFVYIKNVLPPNTMMFGELYKQFHDDKDGMIHMTWSRENTFGAT